MNIDIIFKIAGIGVVTTVINYILERSDKKELSILVTLTALVIVLLMVANMIGGLFDTLKSLFNLY